MTVRPPQNINPFTWHCMFCITSAIFRYLHGDYLHIEHKPTVEYWKIQIYGVCSLIQAYGLVEYIQVGREWVNSASLWYVLKTFQSSFPQYSFMVLPPWCGQLMYIYNPWWILRPVFRWLEYEGGYVGDYSMLLLLVSGWFTMGHWRANSDVRESRDTWGLVL